MSIQPAWSYGGGGSGEVADGSITTAKLADPAGMPTVRRAAGGGGAASGTKSFALVSYAPSTTTFSGSVKLGSGVVPAATCLVVGNGDVTGRFNLLVHPNGALEVRSGASSLAMSSAGVFDYGGGGHRISWAVTSTSCQLSYDGMVVASTAFASVAWVTTAYNWQFGAAGPSGGQRWPGTFYDLHLLDPASTANTAFFPLDGDFVNTAPGSSVADATPSGFISWPTVLSTGGSERAVLAGGPYVVQMSRDGAAQALNGSVSTSYVFTFSSTDLDETGGANSGAGTWTAPGPGVISVLFTTRFPAAVLTEEVGISLRKDGTAFRSSTQRAGANQVADCIGATTVEAGDVVDAFIDNIDAGNTTLTATNGALVIQFTPRP